MRQRARTRSVRWAWHNRFDEAMADAEEKLTLSVRLIRSFEYRNIKTIVLRQVSPHTLVKDFMTATNAEIQESTTLNLPFKRHAYDTLKINSYAHGAKTNDTAINTEREDWILEPDKSLNECGIRNETELSYFNRNEYEAYKENPQLLW